MSQCHYNSPLTHYPAVYGVSYRTILRWAAKGYPLDDEPATRLLVAEQKNGPRSNPPAEHTNTPSRPPDATNAALGLSASIKRLQEAEAQAHADYLAAVAQGDSVATNARQRQWLALSEQLRKTESSTPEVEEANRKSIRLAEIQQVLSGLFLRLRQDLEGLPKRVALELVGQDAIGVEQTLNREVEAIISSLFRCEYLKPGAESE